MKKYTYLTWQTVEMNNFIYVHIFPYRHVIVIYSYSSWSSGNMPTLLLAL